MDTGMVWCETHISLFGPLRVSESLLDVVGIVMSLRVRVFSLG